MVPRQLGRAGVFGGTADRAGLPRLQLLGQQARPVGVELPLQRGVLSLGLVQRGLGLYVVLLAGGGRFGGLIRRRQAAQQGFAGGGQVLRQFDVVFQPHLLGVGLAQGVPGGLGVGDGLFQRVAAGLQLGLQRLGLALHLRRAGFLRHQPRQLTPPGYPFLGQLDPGVSPGDLLVQVGHDLVLPGLDGLVKFQQPFGQVHRPRRPEGVPGVLDLLQFGGGLLVGPGAQQAAHMHEQHLLQTAAGLVGLPGVADGRLSQPLVVGGVKDLAQDVGAVGGRRVEQPGEVVLGQHGHLGKLLGVDAQQLDHRRRHGLGARDRGFRFPDQFRPGRAFHDAAAPLGGALLLRPAAHHVGAAPVGEGQLHEGLGVGGGEIAAQHGGLAVFAGGLAVEGKGDGVKQGGLAGAGVAADQEQAAAAEFGKIQLGAPGIGPEGTQGQVQGFHALAASSRSCFTARASSMVRGRPFIWVKKSWNSSAKGLPRTARAASAGPAALPRGW